MTFVNVAYTPVYTPVFIYSLSYDDRLALIFKLQTWNISESNTTAHWSNKFTLVTTKGCRRFLKICVLVSKCNNSIYFVAVLVTVSLRITHTTCHIEACKIWPKYLWRQFQLPLKCKYFNANEVSLQCVPERLMQWESALVNVMAWHRTGNKPLHEPMMTKLTKLSDACGCQNASKF